MTRISYWLITLAALSGFGCGGGSSSGSSSGALSSGQDPDPVVVDFPVAFVERPLLTDDDGNLLATDVREPTTFFPGAQLIIRDRASPSAAETVITEGIFPPDEDGNPPLYDVKDLTVSFDGQQLAFAMRAPEDPDLDEDEQPTWNIWLFDRETATLQRIITSDIVAETGEDVAPQFLPDGRIVFASTRQRQAKAVLLDEGKPQFSSLDEDRDEESLNLHVMNADGTDLQQITFNSSSDIDPSVLGDGRIVFSRWDNVAGRDRISLYSTNPDGTDQQLLYGVHSHDTGPDGETVEFVEPIELADGRLLVMIRPPGRQTRLGALPVAIDTINYVEHDQPTFTNAGLLADAQELLIPGDLTLDEDRPPLQGRYAHIWPLYDGTNRLMTAWSQCRLLDTLSEPDDPVIVPCTDENLAEIDPDTQANRFVEADPLYGVWINDVDEGTQQPIVVGQEGLAYSEVAVMESRVSPPVILDRVAGLDLDADLVSESVGVVHIRSVYDFAGAPSVDGSLPAAGEDPLDVAALADPQVTTADQRPARFVRIVKSVSIPDDDLVDLDGTAFGRSQAQLMREVIGYAHVEPDGSTKFRVPANIAFWIEVLDADGRRLTFRHNNWLQLRPGEEMECNGCHTPNSELPHGRLAAEAPSINFGAPVDGSPFPNTNDALFADGGETMAEVITRINGIPEPAVDIRFDDLWTDPDLRAPDASFAYNYSDLSTQPPTDPGCVTNWNSACRITIHFPDHIHPLWSVDRSVVENNVVISDDTCTSCHNIVDADGAAMVPAAQLDLSDGPSADEADHLKSYRELLFNDNEQELVDGAVQDLLVQATDGNGNLLFETDANGDLILDIDNNPIPILVPVGVAPSLNVAGARFSPRFFALFGPAGTHNGRLTPAELKLISEWIDIGGQYYNDPFVVPQ